MFAAHNPLTAKCATSYVKVVKGIKLQGVRYLENIS